MRGRLPTRPLAAAAAVVIALVAASCTSAPPAHKSSASTSTTTTTQPSPVGPWSKAIAVVPGGNLTAVSCPAPGTCLLGTDAGQTYRLTNGKPASLGPAVPSPSPQGVSYLSCATPTFCAAAPSLNR
ncbi:MAG TPA: hypothetical protein VIX84_11735, partial [Acidimicrobiales bacterium]